MIRRNVAAVVRTSQLDLFQGAIGNPTRRCVVLTDSHGGEHTPSCRDDSSVGLGGSGVNNVGGRVGLGGFQSGDDVASSHLVRVSLGRKHDSHSRVLGPSQWRTGEAALGSAEQQPAQRSPEARKHDLSLRIAEPHVELHHSQTPRRQCEPAVQQSHEGCAAPRHLINHGLCDPGHHLFLQVVGNPREGRIGSHTAGVGAGVAVVRALEILRGSQRHNRAPVADAEERDLGAVQVLLDEDCGPALGGSIPVILGEAGPDVGKCLVAIGGDDDALSCRQAVILDHVGSTEGVQGGFGLLNGHAHPRHRGGYLGNGHDLLGEGLRPLQACRFARRSENRESRLPEVIRDTDDQRSFRTDDDEIHLVVLGQGDECLAIKDVHGSIHTKCGGSGIPRSNDQIGDGGIKAQCPREGMFAAARADKEDSHVSSVGQMAPPTCGFHSLSRSLFHNPGENTMDSSRRWDRLVVRYATHMTLLDAAGTLSPQPESATAVAGALRDLATDSSHLRCATASNYPAQCIDGRPFAGQHSAMPRSAGGSLTTWVVDFLLTGVFAPEQSEAAEQSLADVLMSWLDATCATLVEAGLPVSGHRDDHANGAKAGCGAADSLGVILALLGSHPAGIDALLTDWGIDPADLPDVVFARAREAAAGVPSGPELIAVIGRHAQEPLPTVTGAHLEAAVIANSWAGHTVRPGAGPTDSTQAFGIDLWALPHIADFLMIVAARSGHMLAASDAHITATAAAFNAAALLVLCSPDMPSIVLRED